MVRTDLLSEIYSEYVEEIGSRITNASLRAETDREIEAARFQQEIGIIAVMLDNIGAIPDNPVFDPQDSDRTMRYLDVTPVSGQSTHKFVMDPAGEIFKTPIVEVGGIFRMPSARFEPASARVICEIKLAGTAYAAMEYALQIHTAREQAS